MVRVISVHHFTSQNVQTVEQPTASTIAPPDRLLLALTSNCVQVLDLKNDAEVLFNFPTVDEVIQILHCLNGDYVATVETKFNRQNKETNFVRVYINWDSIATLQQSKMTNSGISLGSSECGMVQPMRARIAGRVTPTTNQSELGSLEMIEIPVKRNPSLIAVCQISGNLAILSRNIINFYSFQIKTHDISKLKFVDFEEVSIVIELCFEPMTFEISENYVACMSRDLLHLFRIVDRANSSKSIEDEFNFKCYPEGPIDYKKLVKEEALNLTKEKVTVNLPSILKENSIVHKNSPFTYSDKDIIAEIKSNSLENKYLTFKIENLIQLKLIPILIESAQRQITEEFKCLVLKPIYIDETLNKSKPTKNIFHSDFYSSLNSLVCMVATQQEGYLYHFDNFESCGEKDNCIAVYPFTAPVYKLVMEDYFLHALTETGLESYTLRFGHQLCRNFEAVDNLNIACPSIEDSICLVGLRPFLGVEEILLSENHLVLLASSDSSPAHSVSSNNSSNVSFWTLYNLELPTPKTVFNDVSIVANVHRFTSVQTYCHLLSEAHVILRVALLIKRWMMSDDSVRLVMQAKSNVEDVLDTYRTSCALLGDHYVMALNEEEFSLAIPYYKMARLMPFEVLKRVKKIQEQSNNNASKGLMHYLKYTLLDIKNGSDVDRYFGSGTKQNFSEALLDLLKNHEYRDLPALILKSKILREYSTDKLIWILEQKADEGSPEVNLALALLHIQKCSSIKAEEMLRSISESSLSKLLLDHWELLFETQSKKIINFSELSVVLIGSKPVLLSEVLVQLIVTKAFSLSKIIKVFLEFLPSSIGAETGNAASVLLQRTLESYFESYFARPENCDLSKVVYEKGANEAMKLLVRSYLSQLQILQMKEEKLKNHPCELPDFFEDDDKDRYQEKLSYKGPNKGYFCEVKKQVDTFLFCKMRMEYLDKMEPFQIEITSRLYAACVEDYEPRAEFAPNEAADLVLKKLQALMCSQVVPKPVLSEVNAFLRVNSELRGAVALESIILSNHEAVQMLIDQCPQCLLQFGKDRFNRIEEWKFLIATVQRRILKLSQKENLKRVCFFHKKLLTDILTHVASSMNLDQLVQVFPQRFSTMSTNEETVGEIGYTDEDLDILNDVQNYEPFVVICKETMHANQINKLITTTGQQLLSTLNL